MKIYGSLALFCLLAPALYAADAKDEVIKASKKLAEKPNYSWRTTVAVPENARYKPGPVEGKTEKGGVTHLLMSFGDNSVDAVLKGDKGAIKTQDGDWRSLQDVEGEDGPRRFMAGLLRNFKTPVDVAEELANQSKSLKKEGDALEGELTEEGAKAMLSWRRGKGSGGPEISNAKGNVKFWIKEGELSKFEFQVTGSMNFNGNDVDVDRTTTVEIKDVGSTKIVIPEGAQKALS